MRTRVTVLTLCVYHSAGAITDLYRLLNATVTIGFVVHLATISYPAVTSNYRNAVVWS